MPHSITHAQRQLDSGSCQCPICFAREVTKFKNTGGSISQLATHDELSHVSSCVFLWRGAYARCSGLHGKGTGCFAGGHLPDQDTWCPLQSCLARTCGPSAMEDTWLTCGSRVSGRMFTSAPGVQSHDDRRSSQSLSLTCEETGGTHANTTGAIDRTTGLDLLLFSQFGCPGDLRWESLLRAVAPIDVRLASLQI